MSGIGADSVLQRAADLTIELRSDGTCAVTVVGRRTACTSHALAVLDAFAKPRAYGDVIDVLGADASGPADWMALTACVQQLVEAGALRDGPADSGAPPTARNFDQPGIHIAMLDDRGRTGSFQRALRQVVRPDDVVVDIGTGTGVLAISAAQAGARHVYAIEATRLADVATEVIRENGLSDRITVIRGWSTQVTLPERATVLVTEIIGDEPLAEDVLLVTWDARRRLLTPDARMVPAAMRMYAVPVSVPDEVIETRFFTPKGTSRWRDWYGINFDALMKYEGPSSAVSPASEAGSWNPLASPVAFPEIDFRATETTFEMTGRGTFTADGVLGAIAVYFDLELAPGIVMATSPWTRTEDSHWHTPVWLKPERGRVKKGDAFEIAYRFAKPRGDLTLRLL